VSQVTVIPWGLWYFNAYPCKDVSVRPVLTEYGLIGLSMSLQFKAAPLCHKPRSNLGHNSPLSAIGQTEVKIDRETCASLIVYYSSILVFGNQKAALILSKKENTHNPQLPE
jgi:hypothetical protein